MATAPDGEGEDYLKVHRPNMYWFPSKKPTPENDAREIGPYPPTPAPSNDPAQSFQLRPPDLPEYFDPQTRRRFGETLPEEADILSVWAPDVEGDYSLAYMLSGAVLFLATLGGIAYGFTVTHDPETTWRRFAVPVKPCRRSHPPVCRLKKSFPTWTSTTLPTSLGPFPFPRPSARDNKRAINAQFMS